MTQNLIKKTILVVEDEEYLRDLYIQLLQEEGHDVDSAADGEDAYSKMSQKIYDLVVLDIILPKMDGLQILDKLTKEGKHVNKNIVLLTNLGHDVVVARALEFGVRGYMVKSDYTPDELLVEIREYIK
jgi:DNA-binding response OmpR family regulator